MSEGSISTGESEVIAARARTPRQAVLKYFQQRPTDVATVDGLAATICDDQQLTDDKSSVAIRLHHVTLPKLDEAGLLEYDARSKTARYRGGEASGLCIHEETWSW